MSHFQVGKRCWGIGIHQGQPFFCFDMHIADRQYHWRPNFTPKQFDFDETLRTQGLDPDYSKRQLFEKISKGGTMSWTMMIQVMTPEQATKTAFDPFDVTKIWPRGELPCPRYRLRADQKANSRCRKLVSSNSTGTRRITTEMLNRLLSHLDLWSQESNFRQIPCYSGELSCMSFINLIRQWLMGSYRDAQYHRLGSANIHQIPVNCPCMSFLLCTQS